MSFGMACIYSVMGMVVVFFALYLLMLIIRLMTWIDGRGGKKTAPVPPADEAIPAAAAEASVYAPGSAGELRLYDTDPRTAAMLMAIVAEEMQAPLCELRFLSIREIKE